MLRDLDGTKVELGDTYRRRTIVVFWDPGCGFSQRMAPHLRSISTNPVPGLPEIVIISSGTEDSVRGHDMRGTVLLDPAGHAMRAFAAGGTPMAVKVENGTIASPVVAGAGAVLSLINLSIEDPENPT